jgi:hypothetical protein
MSCAAEKAAFLRALIYRSAPSHYSGGGKSHYSAPTALARAYQSAERSLRPKSFGGGRSDFRIKLGYMPTPTVRQARNQDSGWSIMTEGYSAPQSTASSQQPIGDNQQSTPQEITRVDYAPMTYDGSIHKKQQDLEHMIQQEKTDNGTTAHNYGASLY